MNVFIANLQLRGFRLLGFQGFVGFFPKFRRNQGRMFGRIFSLAVPNHTFINGVRNDRLDPVANETLFTNDPLTSIWTNQYPLARSFPGFIQDFGHLGCIPNFHRQLVQIFEQVGFVRMGLEVLSFLVIFVPDRDPTPVPFTPFGTLSQFVEGSFCCRLTLELGETQKHVEHQHAHRGVGIKILCGRNEIDPVVGENTPKLVKVLNGTRNPVDLVRKNNVNVSRADFGQQFLNGRAVHVLGRIASFLKAMGHHPTIIFMDSNVVFADVSLAL